MEVIRGEIMALNTQRTQVLNSCEPKPSIAYTHCMGASGEMSWTSANCQPLEVIDDCRPLSEELTQAHLSDLRPQCLHQFLLISDSETSYGSLRDFQGCLGIVTPGALL